MDVDDEGAGASASSTTSKPRTALAAIMAKAKQAKASSATAGSASGRSPNAKSLKKRRDEHLVTFLDDFEDEASRMLEKMGEVQEALLAKEVQITDGYEQFWKSHKTDFPVCFELYRILLSVPATSVAVESLFSFMAHVDTPSRRSLHPDRLGRIGLSNARARAAERKPHKAIPWPRKGINVLPLVVVARLVDEAAAERWLDEQAAEEAELCSSDKEEAAVDEDATAAAETGNVDEDV